MDSSISKYFDDQNIICISNNFDMYYEECNLKKDLDTIEIVVKYIFKHIEKIDYKFLYFLLNTILLYSNFPVFKTIVLFGIENNIKTFNSIKENITDWNNSVTFKEFISLEIDNMIQNIADEEDINEIKKILTLI